jgi:hypothetical protein
MQNCGDPEKMNRKHKAERLLKLALETGNRYGGRPELLLKEHRNWTSATRRS